MSSLSLSSKTFFKQLVDGYTGIIQAFRPPQFTSDDDETRVADLAAFFILLNIVSIVASSVFSYILSPSNFNAGAALGIIVPIIGVELVGLFLIRKGYIYPVSFFIIGTLWVLFTLTATISGGQRSFMLTQYPLLIMMAGLMLGLWGVTLFAALNIMAVITLFHVGVGQFPQYIPNVSENWLTIQVSAYIAVGLVLTVSLANYQDALKRARLRAKELIQAHTDLEHTNANLEEKVQTRTAEIESALAISREVGLARSLNDLVAQVARVLKERFGIQQVFITVVKADTGEITLDVLGANVAPELYALLLECVRTGETHLATVQLLLPLRANERIVGVLVAEAPDISEHTTLFNAIAGSLAVTVENARLYEEVSQSLTAEREALRLQAAFTAAMNHELRTPLNGVIGAADTALFNHEDDLLTFDDSVSTLEMVLRNGKHLLSLINQILDFAKIEAGQMTIVPEPEVDALELAHEAADMVRSLAVNKGLTLNTIGTPIALTVDRGRLRQVLVNLIGNAIKFTEAGSVTVTVHLEDSQVRFSVIDTGPGIPADKLGLIFKPYRQVDDTTTRKAGGTGLGLAITKQLIELHGGTIGVESEYRNGSTFFFTLPLVVQDHTALKSQVEAASEQLPAYVRNILLVEDSDVDAEMVKRILTGDSGAYRMDWAKTVAEGLTMATALKPDVIILDLLLPDGSGIEFLANIRSDDALRTIPVIVVSAKDLTADDIRRMNGDVAAIHQKGQLQPADLRRSVTRVTQQGN